jgi:crotonobetainyl-CoA:carnitine CoA-transferase CaiB-like acyl-CoA transferase
MTALEGIKILDLTRLLPGAFCSMILADLGADVLKIEEPGKGDYARWLPPFIKKESSNFLSINRNKKSMILNLKLEAGKKIFLRLVKEYDVVLESFRPGTLDGLGIGYEKAKKVNPMIIFCAISGYGQDGPYRDIVGHDINYLGIAGILGITGNPDGAPILPGVQIGDIGGGSLTAAIAILAAIIAREKIKKGQFIDISMTDGAISWLSIHAGKYFADKIVPTPGKMLLSREFPCYQIYPTKDKRYVTLGALEPKFWQNFCLAVNREDLIGSQFATGEEGEKVIKEIQNIFLARTQKEWLETFEGVEACFGPVNTLEEVFSDPHTLHREMLTEIEHPTEGKIKQIGIPMKFSETPGRIKTPPPGFGEHTEEVLKSLGFTKEEIEELKKEKVI